MLNFPDAWRFESPGALPELAVEKLGKLVMQIATHNGRSQEIIETFKAELSSTVGEQSSRSSDFDWAVTDLYTILNEAALNAPMTVQAFYDGCEKLRTAGLAVPDPAHINRVLAEGGSDLAIQPPNLLYGVSIVPSSDLTTPVAATQSSSPAELSEESDVTLTRPTCFVIQPFDKGRYDRRYKETFAPAIEAADLQPYRVDKDDQVQVPIASIEEGIRSAVICLADISTDNPNVWYELGFAFASQTPVVMICGPEREGHKYPFDIQHRTILPYRSDSLGDFTELGEGITKKLKAALRKAATARQSVPAQQDGTGMLVLTPPEILVLANLAGKIDSPNGTTELWKLRKACEERESAISLHRLEAKKFIRFVSQENVDGYDVDFLGIEPLGWSWIDSHEKELGIPTERSQVYLTDDDIPF